jgi:hypothetical protein
LNEGKLSGSLIAELEGLMKTEQAKILAARAGTKSDQQTAVVSKKK